MDTKDYLVQPQTQGHITSKRCSRCGRELPLSAYGKHARNKDGLESRCKDCRRDARAVNAAHNADVARAWRIGHPEMARASREAWITQNKERYTALKREWAQAHREEINAAAAARRRARPGNRRAEINRYRQTHRDLVAQWRKMRKHRQRGALGSFSLDEWYAKCLDYGWRCAYCKAPLDKGTVTQDHVVPISRGGTNHIENVVPCCSPCNSRKHTASADEYRASLGGEA